MSYEEYWEKDCELTLSYKKAFEIKQEIDNQQMWIQGMYTYKAFETVIANVFCGNKGKQEKYFESPIAITEHEKQLETNRNVQKTLAWIKEGQT